MPITIGMGDYRYEYRPDWAKLPRGMEFQAPSAVAVDSHDNLYVFQRGDPPVLVFDRDGELVSQWPRKGGTPADAHLIYVGPDDGVYLADRDVHQILKYTPEGELVMSLAPETGPSYRRRSITRRTCASLRKGHPWPETSSSPTATVTPAFTGSRRLGFT